MNIVILTEKPPVAGDIANVICDTPSGVERGRDWYAGNSKDGNRYCITWCLGHLLELYVPESDGRWTEQALPIIPSRIYLRPIPDGPKDKPRADGKSASEHRLDIIRSLFERADSIIAATDAGREGQGIFENVYNYIGIRKPVRRLWAMSLTEESIREAMSKLEDNASDHYRLLAYAAWERSVADWMVGINATRMLSLSVGLRSSTNRLKVLSQGRVQTPTLCMICDRFDEHRYFKSQPFWYLDGSSVVNGLPFSWRSVDRFDEKSAAVRGEEDIRRSGTVFVTRITTERKTEQPPLLHDLASLQKMANTKYSFSMEDTQTALQSLYLKHLVSYPRTGCRYIPSDVFAKVPSLLKSLTSHPQFGFMAQDLLDSGSLNDRCISDTETADHHALIITGQKPGTGEKALTDTELKIYDLVCMRFIEAFSAPCIADVTDVTLKSAGIEFYSKGRKEISAGWRAAGKNEAYEQIPQDEVENIELSTNPLPPLFEGQILKVDALVLQEDRTKPRPLLTDATLLTSMENAGKRSDDKQVQDTLRDVGIGTPATRSEIKQTLLARDYIVLQGKSIVPTQLGYTLYQTVKDTSLADVYVTAHMEMSLADITEGRCDPEAFENKLRLYTSRVTSEMKAGGSREEIRRSFEALQIRCPRCGHVMRLGDKSAWCNNKGDAGGCGLTVWREQHGKVLTNATMRTLINNGHTSVIKGFVNKAGKPYDAGLILKIEGNTGLTDVVLSKRS